MPIVEIINHRGNKCSEMYLDSTAHSMIDYAECLIIDANSRIMSDRESLAVRTMQHYVDHQLAIDAERMSLGVYA